MSEKRPFGVTLLLWLVLCLSAWGAVRLLAALRSWNLLNEFGARLSPLYLSITGAGWAVAGVALLWGLLSAKRWARWAVPGYVFLWLTAYWIERIFFESSRENLSFSLMVSILLLTVILIIVLNRRTRKFFIKSEEYEQPNEYRKSA
ncbi:MAG TPA: hypothetical protein VHP14_16680 [Anaerolineales bacterium]|nr:hypothetical protein [Anaerolineales bacterium]